MIYIVRHGQTEWNKLGKNQGQTDISLNDEGRRQAYELKEILKEYKFDLVFSSPLKRAKETAQIIADGKIIKDKRLKERCNGRLEGKTKEEIKKLVNTENIYTDNVVGKSLGIESSEHIQNRVNRFLNMLNKKYKGKDILIVTHAGTIISIKYYFEKVYDTNIVGNCKVLKYKN